MNRNGEKNQINRRNGDDLEKYRRLVELQKQMIDLARRYEQTKRECDALREKMKAKTAAPVDPRLNPAPAGERAKNEAPVIKLLLQGTLPKTGETFAEQTSKPNPPTKS
jgi:hypothetical protein